MPSSEACRTWQAWRMCAHPAGWSYFGGVARCERCGTRRFLDYGALRPPGMPSVVRSADGVLTPPVPPPGCGRRPALCPSDTSEAAPVAALLTGTRWPRRSTATRER
ncbi:DUF6255 family natural product biosynthesis protein [Streptomyces triculaminicus]|uniref:DUF6255 family natural product biosynthesis protein n=1 Tax=Streptomyces triculaminicus TaxID=2816232 RepID=UPI0035588F95